MESYNRFSDLKPAFNLLNWMLFRYLQLRDAFRKQFPSPFLLDSDPVERLLTSKLLNKPLSALYFFQSIASTAKLTKTLAEWQANLPDLTEDEWDWRIVCHPM